MFKQMGGVGANGFLNNVKKNCTFFTGWLPYGKKKKFSIFFGAWNILPIGLNGLLTKTAEIFFIHFWTPRGTFLAKKQVIGVSSHDLFAQIFLRHC